MKKLGVTVCLAALLLAIDSSADESMKQVTPDATILATIDRMLGASTVDEAKDEMRSILQLATTGSESVTIVIRPDLIPNKSDDDSEIDVYFMLFYMAGAIKFDLEHPTEAHDPTADLPSAIRAMIKGLQLLKTERSDVDQPLLEDLAKIDEAGGLDSLVKSLD